MTMGARERVLGLFAGREVDRVACYSGMGNVTMAGLDEYGYAFPAIHRDPVKMADAAASSYRLFGYECAVVPFDVCVEAEALGCVMNAYEDVKQLLYPTIREKIVKSPDEMESVAIPADLPRRGRFPVVLSAIRRLKNEVGGEIPVGSWLLGPFTLAGQIMDLDDLFKLSLKKPQKVNALLDVLTQVILVMAAEYRAAGADYITIREMGAPAEVLSPRSFRQLIKPHLVKIFAALPSPKILHICGDTNLIVGLMNECGADALSVETKNDLRQSREKIGAGPLLFGNVDGYNILANGKPPDVERAVLDSLEGGVDAVWPGCDIWPTAPLANLRTMVETVKKYGAAKWVRKGSGIGG